MTKQEIIKEFDERINTTKQVIESIKNGERAYKSKTAKAFELNFQAGFKLGLELAKDYLENYLDKGV